MKGPRLVRDWRRSWRWLSVQIALVAIAWGLLPMETQAAIVEWAGVPPSRVPAVIGLLMILGRLTQQNFKQDPKDEE